MLYHNGRWLKLESQSCPKSVYAATLASNCHGDHWTPLASKRVRHRHTDRLFVSLSKPPFCTPYPYAQDVVVHSISEMLPF